MDGGADGQRARPRRESAGEMRAEERVPILPRRDRPPGPRCGDVALLAATALLALASCCLSAASLCRAAALQAELGSLRAELRAPPGPPRAPRAPAVPGALEASADAVRGARPPPPPLRRRGPAGGLLPARGLLAPAAAGRSRRERAAPGPEDTVIQDCLQLIADSDTPTIRHGRNTYVPWLLSFKRGRALEEKENKILVKETGYFFIYGQVLYTDNTFAMGHVIQRKKVHVFGDELSLASQSWKKEMNSNWQYHGKMLKYHVTETARFSEH